MNPDHTAVELTWTARSVRPAVILQVLAVLLAFMLLALFVFHSVDAVVSLAPGALGKIEYRATDAGVDKRRVSHVIPTQTGFKLYKRLELRISEPRRPTLQVSTAQRSLTT